MNDGRGRLPHVTERLRIIAQQHGLDLEGKGDSQSNSERFAERFATALQVGARDVFLTELLNIARAEGIEEAALQAGCSNLPVPTGGLARMLAGGEDPGDLIFCPPRDRTPRGVVDRGSDAGRRGLGASLDRAGSCRGLTAWKRTRRASDAPVGTGCGACKTREFPSIVDAIEALRGIPWLAGLRLLPCVGGTELSELFWTAPGSLYRWPPLLPKYSRLLPDSHEVYPAIADAEATARLALGQTDRALRRYEELLQRGLAAGAGGP